MAQRELSDWLELVRQTTAEWDPSDWVGLLGLLITIVTLPMVVKQLSIQNRLGRAQLLQSRYDMYWRTTEPVTEEHLKEFDSFPEDWIDRDRLKDYYNDKNRKIKYIKSTFLLEYLAHSFTLREKLKVDDPLGHDWLDLWVAELMAHTEFRDALSYYEPYYPDFAKFARRVSGEPSQATLTARRWIGAVKSFFTKRRPPPPV